MSCNVNTHEKSDSLERYKSSRPVTRTGTFALHFILQAGKKSHCQDWLVALALIETAESLRLNQLRRF